MNWPFGDLQMFGFDMLVVDPPWRFQTFGEGGREKSAEKHYDTLTCAEIIERFPVDQLASGDAVLWLWATNPMVDQQIAVGRAWGFEFKTMGVWVKRTQKGKLAFGTGYRLRCASEPFLIFTVGNPQTARNIRTVIEGPVREHSQKPEESYHAAEQMMPNARRVEIFSRTERPGWAAWGDEQGKFGAVA